MPSSEGGFFGVLKTDFQHTKKRFTPGNLCRVPHEAGLTAP